MSGPLISEFGGNVLVRSPTPKVREGNDSGTVIIIEFDSIENACEFYNSDNYTAAVQLNDYFTFDD